MAPILQSYSFRGGSLSPRAGLLMLILLALVLIPPPALAQDEAQYRRIELVDGTIVYGEIVTSDAESLTVRSQKGEVIVPWMDVIDLTEISADEYEEKVTLRLAYIGTRASNPDLMPSAEAVGVRFQDAVAEAPRINLLRTSTLFSSLGAEQQAKLESCSLGDAQCVGDAAHSARLAGYLYGVVEPVDDQARATFTWISLEDTAKRRDITVPFKAGGLPAQSSLITAVWHLLELDESTKPQVEPIADKQPSTAVAQTTGGYDTGATASKAPGYAADDSTKDSTNTSLTRGRFLPLPGAPALLVHERTPFLVSVGATGVLTISAVYVVGGVGLSVPWDAHQASWANPLFLTGVGLVSYVAISLVSNQIVARTVRPPRSARLSVSPAPGGLTLRF